MPKIKYRDIKMGPARLAVVLQANQIIAEYQAKGYSLTLRQLYYQFVSRALIPNRPEEYKKLGDVVNDGRLAGHIDWLAIEDRTRNLEAIPAWDNPGEIVDACARQFQIDMWEHQADRLEVWIEKDALTGVIDGVCKELRVPYFSCRGYTSQSEMWVASQRLLKHGGNSQGVAILHLGDHDPSGIDMSRDIQDRLELFTGGRVEFKRLALNMPQVEQYGPPPNPAKLTDSRCQGYMAIHGDESWELDALDPAVISELIRAAIEEYKDDEQWERDEEKEREMRDGLATASRRWDDVVEFLEGGETA